MKKKYCEECQENEEAKEELNLMEQNQMLKKQLSEQQKEIEFLKKLEALDRERDRRQAMRRK